MCWGTPRGSRRGDCFTWQGGDPHLCKEAGRCYRHTGLLDMLSKCDDPEEEGPSPGRKGVPSGDYEGFPVCENPRVTDISSVGKILDNLPTFYHSCEALRADDPRRGCS